MSIYLALHTHDPSAQVAQQTNEVSYTGYARKKVVPAEMGWVVEIDPLEELAALANMAEAEVRRARAVRENAEMAARIRRKGRRRAGVVFRLPTRAG